MGKMEKDQLTIESKKHIVNDLFEVFTNDCT